MKPLQIGAIAGMLLLAVSLQYAGLDLVSVLGVVPNLVLLVTVAAALARGLSLAAPVGFAGGLLMDLSPPADHPVGAWALALLLVALLASRVRDDARSSPLLSVLVVGACSFVATSTFAFVMLVTSATTYGPGQLLGVIGISLLWDVALAPWVIPPLLRAFDRLQGQEPVRP